MNTIILNTELEFRNYIIKNINNILQIILFEDELDQIIFFYCFFQNDIIIATKEPACKNFSFYKKTYHLLNQELSFIEKENKSKSLRLIKS